MLILPKAITFDCYGTLIDWESSIQQFFAQRLAAHNIEGIDIPSRTVMGLNYKGIWHGSSRRP
jgi:FMN phosphatase YigB (HAD superfamily)